MLNARTAAAMAAAATAVTLLAGPAAAHAAPAVPPSPQWSRVSAGGGFTCAVQTNRTLWCWGDNEEGELGIRSHASHDAPVRVGLRAGWVQVAAGSYHACAVRNDGTLWCWGDNHLGELGDGTTTASTVPVQVGTATDWASVTGSDSTECALRTDGTLWCWGYDDFGQVGNGTGGLTTDIVVSPVQIGAADWTSVSAGVFTCGVQAGGSAWCWGSPVYGYGYAPAPLPGGGAWASVSVGGDSACGIQTDQTVWCWGDDNGGQLGGGKSGPPASVPVQAAAGDSWRQVTAGGGHVCALHGGSSWCWGNNAEGQAGNGTTATFTVPVKTGVPPSYNWAQVSAGGVADTCGIQRGGSLWCWGLNYGGQLGIGSTAGQETTPQQVT